MGAALPYMSSSQSAKMGRNASALSLEFPRNYALQYDSFPRACFPGSLRWTFLSRPVFQVLNLIQNYHQFATKPNSCRTAQQNQRKLRRSSVPGPSTYEAPRSHRHNAFEGKMRCTTPLTRQSLRFLGRTTKKQKKIESAHVYTGPLRSATQARPEGISENWLARRYMAMGEMEIHHTASPPSSIPPSNN